MKHVIALAAQANRVQNRARKGSSRNCTLLACLPARSCLSACPPARPSRHSATCIIIHHPLSIILIPKSSFIVHQHHFFIHLRHPSSIYLSRCETAACSQVPSSFYLIPITIMAPCNLLLHLTHLDPPHLMIS